jgi:hypothetical protein
MENDIFASGAKRTDGGDTKTDTGVAVGEVVEGAVVGSAVVGDEVGFFDGAKVGVEDGIAVGALVGLIVGEAVVGALVGARVGRAEEGEAVGVRVGETEGAADGLILGACVGDTDSNFTTIGVCETTSSKRVSEDRSDHDKFRFALNGELRIGIATMLTGVSCTRSCAGDKMNPGKLRLVSIASNGFELA